MPRVTVSLSDAQYEWVDARSGEIDDSLAEVLRQLIDSQRLGDAGSDADLMQGSESDAESDALRERLAELEARVESLESAREPPETAETRSRTRSARRESRGERVENTSADPPSGDIEDILAGWPPRGTDKREDRRAAAADALRWLRDSAGVAGRTEFVEEFYTDENPPVSGQSEDTFWRKTIRAALAEAVEAGVVELHKGRWDYEWVGESPTQ